MANKNQLVTLRGKLSFAKLLGNPVPNYNKDGNEWKTDFQISKDSIKELKAYGVGDRVKTKDNYLDGQPFLSFKHPALKKDGEANDPIPVVDIRGAPWNDKELLGNGTDADIKFVIVDFGPGKKKGVYLRSVRILKLVPYAGGGGFDAVDEDDEFYNELLAQQGAENALEVDELNDDVDDVV